MKKFFRILRAIWVPLIFVVFAAYLLLGLNVVPVGEMVDEMIRTADAGIIVDDYYTNYKLGIQFYTPPQENGEWRPMTYQEQFTRQPGFVYKAAKAEFAILQHDDKPYPDFIFRSNYTGLKTSRRRNETSEEYAQKLRDDNVRSIVSGNRDAAGMYDKSYEYSDIEPAAINGKIYYKYSTYNNVTNNHFLTYVIKEGDFGFRFMFYGQDEEIDEQFVRDVMYSLVYTDQDFNVDYKRKTFFN